MLRDQAMLESYRTSGRYKIDRILEEDAKSYERKYNTMSMLTKANGDNISSNFGTFGTFDNFNDDDDDDLSNAL